MKIEMDYETKKVNTKEIIITGNCGDRIIVESGNSVADILVGHRDKTLIIDIYPFESKKPYHYLIRDEHEIIKSK